MMAAFILLRSLKISCMEFYLAVLESVHNDELPDTIVSDATLTFQSVRDLMDVGYLTGTLVTTAQGPAIQQVAITESGLRFLERNAGLAGKREWHAGETVLGFLLASAVMFVFLACLVFVIRQYFF